MTDEDWARAHSVVNSVVNSVVWLSETSGTRTNPFIDAVLAHAGLAVSTGSDGAGTVESSLQLAGVLATLGARPGEGVTLQLWEALATLGARDLGVARAIEPHLDAVAIFAQAGTAQLAGSWGVFAAAGSTNPVVATLEASGWTLTGTKPWCSLAATLDRAIVTATDPANAGGIQRLFAVDLRDPSVTVHSGTWHSRGLAEIASEPVDFSATPAMPVGGPGWYLSRPGFAWGSLGVAACWYGGAVALARTILTVARKRPADDLVLMHLGAVDESLQCARRALSAAAVAVDAGADVRLQSKRVRATVVRACEEVIERAGHALGPAPLAQDEEHAKRVADLTIYVRQHHAERDQVSLGRAVVETASLPW